MAPRATAIKKKKKTKTKKNRDSPRQWQQGLRLLKEDQSDQSVRQSGASLIRWTSGHPPIKSVADFLMCLFEDIKLQPSTIDGYRSAIADKLGILPVIISKSHSSPGSFP